ncbi:hypothetical protein ACMGE7_05295 [Macrococcus equi]|uniref:hypothetical protein n=1 Tax=Macrococcus equi TaxID=3395462 RepID=UPI0039BE7E62
MKKIIFLDFKLLKSMPFIIIGLFLSSIILKAYVDNGSLTRIDQNVLTFNFADTFFILLMTCIFYLQAQKYDQLRKLKATPWYESLPMNKSEIIKSNLFIVIFPHLLLLFFASVFYTINDDFFKFHGMMMMFGLSLIMNGLMIIFDIKNQLIYIIIVGFGGALLIFAFGFHYLLVMNDFNMNLNLEDNLYWNFYLYELPYILTLIGIITCFSSYWIKKQL